MENIGLLKENIIEEKTISAVPVKQVKDIDNIVINPNSKIIHIRTLIKKLDSKGNALETKRGEDITVQDKPGNPGTDEIEATEPTTDYTDFMKAIGLTKANITNAIKTHLEKMKLTTPTILKTKYEGLTNAIRK